jgi:hypothetical protein
MKTIFMGMTKTKLLLTCLLLPVVFPLVHAQKETLAPIGHRQIEQQPKKGTLKSASLSSPSGASLRMPFFDDFTNFDNLPDPSRWVSNNVWVNNNLAYSPVSLGVATFDALKGNLRNADTLALGRVWPGDTLTSLPIIILPTTPDVYLSFLYQQGGRGDSPESQDSLILQFFSVDSLEWRSVWKAVNMPGDSSVAEISGTDTVIWKPEAALIPKFQTPDTTIYVKLPGTQTNFKYVHLPIDQDIYKKPGFRFRFVNYYSLKTEDYEGQIYNADLWHLDYVKLDSNRSASENQINDLAFVSRIDSILNEYTHMPASHFCTSKGSNQWSRRPKIYLMNNHDKNIKFNRTVILKDEIKNIQRKHVFGIDSVASNSMLGLRDFLDPSVNDLRNYLVDECQDSARFTFTYAIEAEPNDADFSENRQNDTLSQVFSMTNFYAYDDGTPEWGYGITNGRNASVAIQFESFKEDTLQGAKIYFNRPYKGIQTHFMLSVWSNANGLPGTLIYSEEKQTGNNEFSGSNDGFNQFQFYKFDTTLLLNGPFFIGWQQIKDQHINIGFDTYFNNSRRNFLNTGGSWRNSTLLGTIMIRPVFGRKPVAPVGIKEQPVPSALSLDVYPNPVQGYLYVSHSGIDGQMEYSITDLQGRTVQKGLTEGNSIDCSGLKKGIYIFSFQSNGQITHKKIIVAGTH